MAYQYRSPLEGSYGDEYVPRDEREVLPHTRGARSGSIRHRNVMKPSSSSLELQPFRRSRPGFNPTTACTDTSSLHGPGSSIQPKYSDRFKSSSYPQELTDMFGALECKLCAVQVESPIVAKMHYSGKQHLKKIKTYLLEWSSRTGLPMPTVETPILGSTGVEAFESYCKVCDVQMTSLSDKIQHYSGKLHLKNEINPGSPRKKMKTYETHDVTPRFGIGSDFNKEIGDTSNKSGDKTKEFVCDLCDVKAVSKEQLNIHLGGKKHKEKLRKKDRMVPYPVNPSVSILSSVVKDQPRDIIDHSMHRTPTGHYFCGVCNLTLNSEHQFIEHIENKKHKKNFTGKKTLE